MSIAADPRVRMRAAQRRAPAHVARPADRRSRRTAPVTLSVPSGRSGLSPTPAVAVTSLVSRGSGQVARPASPRRRSPRRGHARRAVHSRAQVMCDRLLGGGDAPVVARRRSVPSTSSRSQRRWRARDERGDRVGDVGVRRGRRCARARGRRACRPRSSRSRRRGRGTARRPSWPAAARRGPRARSAPSTPGEQHAWRSLLRRGSPASLLAAPSTPRPTRAPASQQVPGAGDARPEARVGRRAVRDARSRVSPIFLTASSSRWTRGRTTRRRRSSPGSSTYSSGRAAEPLRGRSSSSSIVSARWVCSRTPRGAPARPSRASAAPSPRTASRARARRAASSPASGSCQRSIAASDVAAGSRRGPPTTWSGGSPPSRCPRSIEPRRGVEAQAHVLRGADLRAEHVAAVAREEVVVVGRGRAAGQRQLRQSAGRAVCTACSSSIRAQTG